MERWVEISFDCLPLRSVSRLDAPLDASPALAEKVLRIKKAIERHGVLNTYYLHHAKCVYHLTNDPALGLLEFHFEGTLITDATDTHAIRSDLLIQLNREHCEWLNATMLSWWFETVHKAVEQEFNRFIAAGDLTKTRQRLEQLENTLNEGEGYLGMYL